MGRRDIIEEKKMKRIVYAFSITLIFSIVVFILVFVNYNKKLQEESRENLLELGRVNSIVPNNEIEETSYTSDKGKNEVSIIKNENKNTVKPNLNSKKTVKETTPVPATIVQNEIENNSNKIVESSNNVTENQMVETSKKELEFCVPVSGEILKDFAKDTLIYSNTLEEWTTHPGIDIRADKTTIVVAAEEGIIESIKNDPRYGISITIKHNDNFKTIYSNLLTTEFIKEGEKVEKGQTIATIGESASFEISDDSHLHFEMYKDGENVNPTIYLK